MHGAEAVRVNSEARNVVAILTPTLGTPLLLPLRWFTQEFRYYVLYLPILHTRPRGEAIFAAAQLIAVWSVLYFAATHELFAACWYGWIIPGRIASMALACTFDYLPHRPHSVSRYEDPYKVTLAHVHNVG